MIVIDVPTISIKHEMDFLHLFYVQQRVIQAFDAGCDEVHLNFKNCRFLSNYAVAVLGGLHRYAEHLGHNLIFNWSTIEKRILANLLQNGFAGTFGYHKTSWEGNSIPYREDYVSDKTSILSYLRNEWLGRGWVHISDKLSNLIAGTVWEIYTNTFEHSSSPVGTFSCGQYYPTYEELHLTVVDFGIGIPANVRNFHQRRDISGEKALQWAFQQGATTIAGDDGGPRGLGLGILREFIRVNRGTLHVFSQDGHARIGHDADIYEPLRSPFQGSLIDITLSCDESYYALASEINE